jgi:hypothetical protein
MNLPDKFEHLQSLKGEEMQLELSRLSEEEQKYINARMVVLSLEQKITTWKNLINEMEISQDITQN